MHRSNYKKELKMNVNKSRLCSIVIATITSVQLLSYPDILRATEDSNVSNIYFPEDVNNPAWVEERRDAQLNTREQIEVFHDFTFKDKQPDSSIDFKHQYVDDAGKSYKAVHYDHGNGIAVADVDNDRLLDIYFISQSGANALYRNLGFGVFEDITENAGVAVDNSIGVAASFADIDNDGDQDLYVTNVRSPNRLFENKGDGTFKDISEESGLDYSEHSSAAVFFDYNNDGLVDLFLSVIGEYTSDVKIASNGIPDSERTETIDTPYYEGHKDAFAGHLHKDRERMSRLYLNAGENKFVDVTEEMGLVDYSWTGAATPTDFNEDGWSDLYLLNMQGHDQYWVNIEGKKFEKQSREVFPKTPWGAMGVKSFDFDNDGDMDLMISDMHSDMSEKIGVEKEKLKADWIAKNWSESFLLSEGNSIYGNALYQNNGKGKFKEVSDKMNAENYWPWGLSVGDINADGWQDIFLASSMNYPFRYGPNSILLNNNGKRFVDAEYIVGVEPRRDNRTSKPWIQLACHEADQGHTHCDGDVADVVIHGALGTRSSAIFDIDQDGDLDIVTNEFGDVPQLLISNLSDKRGKALNYVAIKLIGNVSNRNGLGAKVTIKSGESQWVQVHDGQSGYLSQSNIPLYFGLGDLTTLDTISIMWPSGIEQEIKNDIPTNTTLVIVESKT